MSELTTSSCTGKITRIDPDFLMIGPWGFWLEPTLKGTEGIMLGDMVQLRYDNATMQVVEIAKIDEAR